MVSIFWKMGLKTNVVKTKFMVTGDTPVPKHFWQLHTRMLLRNIGHMTHGEENKWSVRFAERTSSKFPFVNTCREYITNLW